MNPFEAVTLRYQTEIGGQPHHVERKLAACSVDTIGRQLLSQPEDEVWNIAVLNRDGEDVTFDFPCFTTARSPPGRTSRTCGPRGTQPTTADASADDDPATQNLVAEALLAAAAEIEQLPQDYACDPGRAEAVAILRERVASLSDTKG